MSAHKILVVDDSATARAYFSDLFADHGYEVITAEDGSEALRKARDERPSLVLLDVVMPGLSGFQVTRTLARDPTTHNIPVLICTGKSGETDRIWGMRQGARDYLIKPVADQELLALVARLLSAAAQEAASERT
jgi:twitching motility two-component system response regulator PilH